MSDEFWDAELKRRQQGFVTKDSGTRATYDSGMVRDTQDGKPRFDLLVPEGIPFDAQFLTRCAALMARGAVKYEDRNWEKADSTEELARFRASAFRHLMQWLAGERDEDHAAAVVFNLLAAETTEFKMTRAKRSEVVINAPCVRIGGCLAEIGARCEMENGPQDPNLWQCVCGRTPLSFTEEA